MAVFGIKPVPGIQFLYLILLPNIIAPALDPTKNVPLDTEETTSFMNFVLFKVFSRYSGSPPAK